MNQRLASRVSINRANSCEVQQPEVCGRDCVYIRAPKTLSRSIARGVRRYKLVGIIGSAPVVTDVWLRSRYCEAIAELLGSVVLGESVCGTVRVSNKHVCFCSLKVCI
jgi:hypothetical protein